MMPKGTTLKILNKAKGKPAKFKNYGLIISICSKIYKSNQNKEELISLSLMISNR